MVPLLVLPWSPCPCRLRTSSAPLAPLRNDPARAWRWAADVCGRGPCPCRVLPWVQLFHELVHELSQTSLYRVLADEVIWEFEEGMEEALGGEQLLLAAIKLSLKGDASEVYHMRKCTAAFGI